MALSPSSADDYLGSHAPSERRALLHSLKGKHVQISDMRQFFSEWPGDHYYEGGVNENLKALQADVNQRLESVYGADQNRLRGLKSADFGLFAALWWPQAAYEELRILAYFSVWIFNWDDQVDEPSGAHASSAASAAHFRETTTRFVAFCLGLGPWASEADFQHSSVALNSFAPIGSALLQKCPHDQRQRFFDEWQAYAHAAAIEQRDLLEDRVPSFAEYWRSRAGTSAVRLILALVPFAGQLSMPSQVFDCLPMKTVWAEVNNMISATNDLLSLKKEVRRGCIYNFVALHSHTYGVHVNDSVQAAIQMVWQSRDRWTTAANALIKDFDWSPAIQAQLRVFLGICQSMCVGNLVWSEQTPRYGMAEWAAPGGGHTFILE